MSCHFADESRLLTPLCIRLLRIEHALRSGRVVSGSRLATLTGGSRATLNRDLHLLRTEMDAVIVYDPQEHGYRLVGTWQGVAPAVFQHLELV